tara:strand:+ start:231 stop:746 length:516 start_codon:yes stop_codon:yes gene_type:complete
MPTRKIFFKKSLKNKIIVWILILVFLLISYFYFILNKKNEFIIIPENTDIFYIVPKDKGGEKVQNLDKKSLNSKSQIMHDKIYKPDNLLYGIQFFSNSEYENVNNFLINITNNNENIYQINEFYILPLHTEIGIEYFLIYKNFKTRNDALDYCTNFLTKIDNCLIVDTTKF